MSMLQVPKEIIYRLFLFIVSHHKPKPKQIQILHCQNCVLFEILYSLVGFILSNYNILYSRSIVSNGQIRVYVSISAWHEIIIFSFAYKLLNEQMYII